MKKICPVCKLENSPLASKCTRCGWDLIKNHTPRNDPESGPGATVAPALPQQQKSEKGDWGESAGEGCLGCMVPFPISILISLTGYIESKFKAGTLISSILLFLCFMGTIAYFMVKTGLPAIEESDRAEVQYNECKELGAIFNKEMSAYKLKHGDYSQLEAGNDDVAAVLGTAGFERCGELGADDCARRLQGWIENACGTAPAGLSFTSDASDFELHLKVDMQFGCNICVTTGGVFPEHYAQCQTFDSWDCDKETD